MESIRNTMKGVLEEGKNAWLSSDQKNAALPVTLRRRVVN